jgi:hypothetical protein
MLFALLFVLPALAQSALAQSALAQSKVEIEKTPLVAKAVVAELAPPVELVAIKRVYVDKFGGGAAADHLREMLISSLQNSRLFIVTEDQDNADAVLKGSAEDEAFKEVHNTSDNSHVQFGGSRSSSLYTGGRYSSRQANQNSSHTNLGENESSKIEGRKHEASAAVRLVAKNGDVIWSTTQESLGAKFRGASADVADKITRQLASDWQKARRGD